MTTVPLVLAEQEDRVCSLVAKGYDNKRIAAELGCSVHTVKNHLHVVYIKLGVTNRTAAAVLWLRDHPEAQ